VTVTGEEHERLTAVRSVAPEVYESYLKALFVRGYSKADFEERIAYFEEAIRKDPTFAPAYLGLSEAYDDLGDSFVGGPTNKLRPEAISAAQKALELDPQLAEAHARLAEIYQSRWQWTDAESEYRLALKLNSNDAAAQFGFANWLVCQGRLDEALAWSRSARELDPLGISGVQTGWILFHSRRYDEAIRELRSVLAVQPEHTYGRWALGFALIGNGQSEEAIPEIEKTASMMHRSPGSIDLLATANARAGRRSEALRLINELKGRRKRSYVPADAFINPNLALGNYEEAFVWFERAYHEQSDSLQYLKVHPFFDPVREDPRFKDLIRRVGLH
jgi:tetratricopeptide (TPR) repeat protein